jgi:hypothetical protein
MDNLKERWVAALRSGKYRQGWTRLRNGGSFCCLGVLCDLIAPNEWETEIISNRSYWRGCLGSVPLSTWNEIFPGENQRFLMDMNDAGVSFAGIADYIEREFLREEEEPVNPYEASDEFSHGLGEITGGGV